MSTFGNNTSERHYPQVQASYGGSNNKSANWEQWRKTLNEIELRLLQYPNLKAFRSRTGFPLVYSIGAVIVLSLTVLYFISGSTIITSVVGVVYPGYMSLKALRYNENLDVWLSYWIWYGLFTLIESMTDVLLFWIPLYQFIKMGFYIYLYAPSTKGALFLYRRVLQPYVRRFQQYEQQILENVQQVKKNISDDSVIMDGSVDNDNTSKINPNFSNQQTGNIPRSMYS